MQETSIFSFFHKVVYPIREKLHHCATLFLSANVLNLDKAKILLSGKELRTIFSDTLDKLSV